MIKDGDGRGFRCDLKAGIGLMLAAAGAAACSSEGDKLAQQYAMIEANRAGPGELCDYAKRVASAYLGSRDEAKFAEWKRREGKDCAAPATARTGPATGQSPPSPPSQPVTGTVTGKLSYPSDYLPEDLTVCAREVDSKKTYCGTEAGMERSGSTYSLRLPPGGYHVWAKTKDMAGTKAYYSESVVCGLDVECKSHKPVTVQLAAGATRKGIDPGDWYDY